MPCDAPATPAATQIQYQTDQRAVPIVIKGVPGMSKNCWRKFSSLKRKISWIYGNSSVLRYQGNAMFG